MSSRSVGLSSRQTLWVVVGVVAVLTLAGIGFFWVTGDPAGPAAAGAAAVAAVAEGARRRQTAERKVEEARQDTIAAAAEVVAVHEQAGRAMAAAEEDVATATDAELTKDGNDLFGGAA